MAGADFDPGWMKEGHCGLAEFNNGLCVLGGVILSCIGRPRFLAPVCRTSVVFVLSPYLGLPFCSGLPCPGSEKENAFGVLVLAYICFFFFLLFCSFFCAFSSWSRLWSCWLINARCALKKSRPFSLFVISVVLAKVCCVSGIL